MAYRQTTAPKSTGKAGFTLVELVIVVLILGILAAIAAGNLRASHEEATAATLRADLRAMYDAIDLNSPGKTPPAISGDWFVGGRIPRHPQSKSRDSTVQIDSTAGKTHPSAKVLRDSFAPYWYNPTNGIIRIRVAAIGNETQTLDFYNLVNDSDEAVLGNYGGGVKAGGGGGGK